MCPAPGVEDEHPITGFLAALDKHGLLVHPELLGQPGKPGPIPGKPVEDDHPANELRNTIETDQHITLEEEARRRTEEGRIRTGRDDLPPWTELDVEEHRRFLAESTAKKRERERDLLRVNDFLATDARGKKFVEDTGAAITKRIEGERATRAKMLTAAGVSKSQQRQLTAIESTGDQAQVVGFYQELIEDLGLAEALDSGAKLLAKHIRAPKEIEDG